MASLVFSLPGGEKLSRQISTQCRIPLGKTVLRSFPDGEIFMRVLPTVKDKICFLVGSLNQPDSKISVLLFLTKTLRDMGVKKIILVCPYLAYMRQDKIFHKGESLTSKYFAGLLSSLVDEMITVDPHLHRYTTLSEIYSIPSKVIQCAPVLADWIKQNIKNPFILGPDSESAQWVSAIAEKCGAHYVVLRKKRLGDKEVVVTFKNISELKNKTPVIMDDIISTGHTMIETIKNIVSMGLSKPVCIGIHAVFAGDAYAKLKQCKPKAIVTANTIEHVSNQINVWPLLEKTLKNYVV
ncbi:MAG: hypothetical protein ACD_73C00181G0002 [uncultured bacterium]|nr:MAG: hypothetical protein ACD_73C00181G0002 [uncultured bacterium]